MAPRTRTLLVTFGILFPGCELAAQSASATVPSACATDSAYHVLDFWIGSWAVVDSAGATLGTNRIDTVLGGCAVTETWHDADGSEGRSLFYYVPARREWRQVWITPRATDVGGLKEKHLIAHGRSMVRFQGELVGPRGATILDRTTLSSIDGRRVRQVIEWSRDGGAIWVTSFDGIYVPMATP